MSGPVPVPPADDDSLRRRRNRGSGLPLLPLLLLLLAVADLRTELLLLLDHFTITSLLSAAGHHPLAVLVLVAQPSLWRRYRRSEV